MFFNFVRLVSKICVKIKYLEVPIIIHCNTSGMAQQGALVIRFHSLTPFNLTLIQFRDVALVIG